MSAAQTPQRIGGQPTIVGGCVHVTNRRRRRWRRLQQQQRAEQGFCDDGQTRQPTVKNKQPYTQTHTHARTRRG
jgi:hypothetical protein